MTLPSARYRCFLLGSETLLAECGEILLAQGHELLGVITSAPKLALWASGRGLRVVDAAGDYAAALREQPFDYLFSITHLAIVPDAVLSLAERGAINFHDGPLPRFAGLNTPVWALLEGAQSYGVSWHWMVAGIDAGDILAQKPVDITPDDTAFSLNTKCFQAGIESFAELIGLLTLGGINARRQEAEGRRYFGKFHRPSAAGALDWRQPAAELATLVRALDHGRHRNPVCSPKVRINDQVLVVGEALAIAAAEDELAEPGTILEINDQELHIATGDGTLAVRRFATTCGREQSIADVVARHGLTVGQAFDLLSDSEAERLTTLNAQLARGEDYWVRRLPTLDAAAIPYVGGDIQASEIPLYVDVRQVIPADFVDRYFDDGAADALVCALAGYLARVGEKNAFDLGYADAALHEAVGDLTGWTATHVPLRFEIDPSQTLAATLAANAPHFAAVRKHPTYLHDLLGRNPPLYDRPELAAGTALPIVIDCRDDIATFRPSGRAALVAVVSIRQRMIRWMYDSALVSSAAFSTMRLQFSHFLAGLSALPQAKLAEIELLSTSEKKMILHGWNATAVDYRRDATVATLFAEQAARTPDAVAVVFENRSLTYAKLNERAGRLAAHLQTLGVGPDRLVGIHLERSEKLVVAVLAVLKAGGAYLPLDPNYPDDRLAFMIDDAAAPVIITERETIDRLPSHRAAVVDIDADWSAIAELAPSDAANNARPENLAYVIYTSGSTGKPKGVMIEHRNVVNFFVGMDGRLEHDPAGTWLAVTSLSFDIHVLELLWTLTRGFQVIMHRDRERTLAPAIATTSDAHSARKMDFSLFYFSADSEEHSADKYRLLLEGAKWGDAHDFCAVWTPERHFHSFGGLYPNPAVTGAAVAAITKNVQIRAGSIVLPLHHPLRVAEEWQVVDNLSNGRAAISVAAGWQPNDFVLMPQNYRDAKSAMFRDLEIVKRLWRGEAVEFPGATGAPISVRTLPRPIQKEIPVWVTTAGNIETYRMAGAVGANVLTHLLGQTIEELAPKIAAYRAERAAHGFDPEAGVVSLMLHTFVGEDESEVRNLVRGPLKAYLGTSLNLLKQYAWAFPAFTRRKEMAGDQGTDFDSLTPDEQDALLEFAFERYYETSGLFGNSARCLAMVDRLKAIGVGEIACLIDFGIPTETVLAHLPQLNDVRLGSNTAASSTAEFEHHDIAFAPDSGDYSLAALLERHHVTHFQCTPSLARMLLSDDAGRAAVGGLKNFLIGGEALPVDLAADLERLVGGTVINMYGPTETTVWSTTQVVGGAPGPIPIGRPIANTQLYILDAARAPVPVGVAGELYIGGDSVTRGYLNRAELTAERFVPDPFAARSAARMYRTGDLVRYRADGVVEFLGRTDHQVKIRGHRIELGEIEARLTAHAGVRQCVVVPREIAAGDVRLVAYYVADAATVGTTIDDAELRKHVRDQLPDYMTPSHFVALVALPLTPNGKIDRKALPAVEVAPATVAAASFVAPESELEVQIAALWQDLLGREQVGLDDNFFDIGGHSLLVVRMHRRLAQAITVPVALTDLFRFPTIRTLTAHLTGPSSSADAAAETADRAKQRRDSLDRRRRTATRR
ncbi:MAG: LLM class flavin-dependent oxidoreductase [Planctomycetia bacterium]|nr:LLM class flavin-dependent oxidoreductase [Planctomycetia bacterium]